ncbi:MAG: methyltransferase [Candidatus Parvarchaeota archaeon]
MINLVERAGVYPVSDDSLLLLKAIDASHGDVLDMCAGTGVVGLNAAKFADFVTLVDVSERALEAIKDSAEKNGIRNVRVVKSDLFSGLDGEMFDVIFMNPPYLPGKASKGDDLDTATVGGEKGYELTKRFILDAPKHLKPGGRIFIILSTRYDVNEVYAAINEVGFEYKILDASDFFFEKIMLLEMYESRRDNKLE